MLLGLATAGAAQAQYQLPNSDFEGEWESVTYSGRTGNEPAKWSSFLDGTGDLKSMAGYSQLEKATERHGGAYSVKLTSRAVKMGLITLAVAQGNITTGCINMGSTTASDAKGNYNYVGASDNTRADQNATFTGHPDALKFWTKFKGDSNYGNVSVYLVTDGYFQDPEVDKNTATKVAHAKNGALVSNDKWTEYTIPFEYYADVAPTHVLASFSTCSNPGKGKAADYMYLDDIVMVYNSELKTATYDGAAVSFAGTAATVDATYDESKLALTSNGRGASIEKNYDAATGLLTITVKGENISEDAANKHEYTIQFNAGGGDPGKVGNDITYTKDIIVTVDGASLAPQAADIIVTYYDDSTIDFTLKNFCLGEGAEAIPVGNISISDLDIKDGKFTYNGGLNITEGDLDGVDFWLGPALMGMGEFNLDLTGEITDADGYFFVNIDLDLTTVIGQVVNVQVGESVQANLVLTEAEASTFVAPFAVTIPDAVTASTVTGVRNNGVLTLAPCSGTIPAETPVVVEGPAETYSFAAIKTRSFVAPTATSTVGLLTGVYSATSAPLHSYVLQSQSGRVGFYLVDGSTIPTVGANRCYLTLPAGSSARALYFGDDLTTAINAAVTTTAAPSTIYDLQGRIVSSNASQKGVFIVNGKKVIK